MTRNLFTQLADMAEYHIRWGRSFVSRERAADLMSDWDAFSESDELQAEVLSRFPKAEPPSVPGLDWLPAVEADAATLVAEAVAVLDEPKADGVDALIERSSLGTPDAVALREQTDDETARRIVERSKALGEVSR